MEELGNTFYAAIPPLGKYPLQKCRICLKVYKKALRIVAFLASKNVVIAF